MDKLLPAPMEADHKTYDAQKPKPPIPKDAITNHQQPDATSARTYQEATGSIWRDGLHAANSPSTL